MNSEKLACDVFEKPFPHLIGHNYYNNEELELIWEELKFYTKPGKLLEARDFGGVVDGTNSHALELDSIYRDHSYKPKKSRCNDSINYRSISNILTVNRKLFTSGILDVFAKIHECCSIAPMTNFDITKVRYYHNGEKYKPHIDKGFQFLAFSYFYKEPKKFTGGELFFPRYNYELTCENNSIIIFPGWVKHGVKEVKIEDSNYYDGWGRYAITNFFTNDHIVRD
tara:strand:- start:122 stop:796 length:675 start_codon:yes stop_codon:yes gene_type:complete